MHYLLKVRLTLRATASNTEDLIVQHLKHTEAGEQVLDLPPDKEKVP